MKTAIITALALSLGVMFFFYRRRLKLAIMVTGGFYIVLNLVRLAILHEEVDRFASLGVGLAVLALVWLATNVATGLIQRRRARRARR